MKSTFWAMMLMVGLGVAGCATSGDIQRVQTQERLIAEKADQAWQEAQSAKAAAEAANVKAEAAAARAEAAAKAAEQRESMAAERAARADAAFEQSMKK